MPNRRGTIERATTCKRAETRGSTGRVGWTELLIALGGRTALAFDYLPQHLQLYANPAAAIRAALTQSTKARGRGLRMKAIASNAGRSNGKPSYRRAGLVAPFCDGTISTGLTSAAREHKAIWVGDYDQTSSAHSLRWAPIWGGL